MPSQDQVASKKFKCEVPYLSVKWDLSRGLDSSWELKF